MRLTIIFFVAMMSATWTVQAQSADSKNAIIGNVFRLQPSFVEFYDNSEAGTDRERKLMNKVAKKRNLALGEKVYEAMMEALKTEHQIEFLPVETLEGMISYSNEGYPMVILPKKAIKKKIPQGTADYYFSFVVISDSALIPGLKGLKPKTTVVIKIFDAKGSKIKDIEMDVKAETYLNKEQFPDGSFDKMDETYIEPFVDLMMPYVKEAITKAVKDI